MLLLADTHVHLYERYDFDRAFSSAFANLRRLQAARAGWAGAPAFMALFLTERQDSHAFRRLQERDRGVVLEEHVIEGGLGDEVLGVRNPQGDRLFVVAGRQIVTRERLEVLALAADAEVADGGDILDTIERAHAAGSVPVLAWAPGKWTGRRRVVVQSVLNTMPPHRLLIGDTSMRPREMPTPRLMGEAELRGFRIVAGTDPLPFRGQESVIGRYGIAADAEIDPERPIAGLRALLGAGGGRITLVGRRDSVVSVAARLLRHRLAS